MATKQTLYDAMTNSANVQAIVWEKTRPQTGGLVIYDYNLLVGTSTEVKQKTVAIYVLDEGNPGEEAWYGENQADIINPPATPFADAVATKAEAAKTNGVVKAYRISSIDEVNKWAEGQAVRDNNGTDEKVEIVAYEGPDGQGGTEVKVSIV